jgi:hypothetical protein
MLEKLLFQTAESSNTISLIGRMNRLKIIELNMIIIEIITHLN